MNKRKARPSSAGNGGGIGRRSVAHNKGKGQPAPKKQPPSNSSTDDEGLDDTEVAVALPSAADAYGALLSSLQHPRDAGGEEHLAGLGQQPFQVGGKKVPPAAATATLGAGKRPRGGACSEVKVPEEMEGQADEEEEGDEAVLPDGFVEHFSASLQAAKTRGKTGGVSKWVDVGNKWMPKSAGRATGRWQRLMVDSAGGATTPMRPPRQLPSFHLRERLVSRWREVHRRAEGASEPPEVWQDAGGPQLWRPEEKEEEEGGAALRPKMDFVSPQQQALFGLLASYQDVYLLGRPYPICATAADPEMDAVLLHCLDHCARVGEAIKKNNDILKALKAEAVARGEKGCYVPPDNIPGDQGFVRGKVLLLLPQRNFAFRAVSRLLQLAIRETRKDTIQGKQRFIEEFTVDESDDEGESGRRVVEKPPDHQAIFSGNLDDHFMLGIKLNRGSVSLYSDFLQSDIIVASPFAIVTRLEEDATAGTKAEGRVPTQDILSSVEILVVDRADFMLMQNWAHVGAAVSALNELPSDQHGTDIMRVREATLAGEASLFRQTVVLSSLMSPELNGFVHRHCRSHSGAARWKPDPEGVLTSVVVQVQQLFDRLPPCPPAESANSRMEHFRKKVWPALKESNSPGQLIFVASYYDFVRLRNFMLKETSKQDFCSLCEHTKRSDVSRGRSNFFHGRRRFMLYTERSHFYNRYFIRGVRNVLFYSLPTHSNFYYEIVNFLETDSGGGGGGHGTVNVLYDKYDALTLERTVGAKRAAKMLKGSSSTFMFC